MNQITARHYNGMTIVVPAFNEEKVLPLTLGSVNKARSKLLSAAGIPTEVIVVDNSSTDGTSQVAERLGARVIRHEIRNIASVRNAGIRAATHELVVTVDADTFLPEHAFLDIWKAMVTGRYIGGGVRLGASTNRKVFHVLVIAIDSAVTLVTGLSAGMFFFDKQAAISIGGFPEAHLAAEDFAFARKLKEDGAKNDRKFLNLHSVRILTMDRKAVSIWRNLGAFVSGIKSALGFKLSKKELGYWYDPER